MKWVLAAIALLEISGSFIVLTLGDLWTVLTGKQFSDPLSDWEDTGDRS